MGLFSLYSEIFANFISKGNLVNRDKISLLGLKPLYDRYLTHDWITKVWVVYSLPVEFEYNLTDLIRKEMFKTDPTVKTSIQFISRPINVDIKNSLFKKRFEMASDSYHLFEDKFNSLSEEKQLTGISELDKNGKTLHFGKRDLQALKEEYDSYYYVYKTVTDGEKFSNTYYFVQASARTIEELDKYQEGLENLLNSKQIYFKQIQGKFNLYLDNFFPTTYMNSKANRFPYMLTSEENKVGLTPTSTRGLVGDNGILLGMELLAKAPFLVDFFGSGMAQVSMLIGKSGSGKTFLAFFIALGLAAINVHFSAIDIKGHEWEKLLAFIKGIVIDFDSDSGYFINTLRIDDLKCETTEDAREAFNAAVRGTVEVLTVAVNRTDADGNPADLHTILESAVLKLMSQNDVIPTNPQTFKRTKNLWYDKVIHIVNQLKTSASFTEEQKKLCTIIVTRLSNFFLSEGTYASSFKKEVTLQEIMDAPAVIYNFNKNSDGILGIIDNLRVTSVQYLDRKKQYMRKREKKHTAAFYEELQRCGNFAGLIQEIGQNVTGSRSNNVIIFLLFNVLSILDSQEMVPIRSNITSKFIGKLEEHDINIAINEYGCAPIENYIKAISLNEDGKFNHCFAAMYDTGNNSNRALFKTLVDKEIEAHFSTRDKLVS